MASRIQELIDQIQTQGVETARQKAGEIEAKAKSEAQKIINDAKKKAEQMTAEARQEAARTQASAQMALKQAARDVILSLRKEIQSTLQKIIQIEVSHALKTEELSNIIVSVAEGLAGAKAGAETLEAVVSPKDLKALKDTLLANLQKQVKQSVKIQASDDVGAGFLISFDGGKSSFDFTDKSLAEYVSIYVNSQVAALLKESATG